MVNGLRNKIYEFWIGIFLSSFGLITSATTVTILFLSSVELDELIRSNLIAWLVAVDVASLFVGGMLTIIGIVRGSLRKIR